jgi:hypothetical protein
MKLNKKVGFDISALFFHPFKILLRISKRDYYPFPPKEERFMIIG